LNAQATDYRADPLVWGRGSKTLEIFVEPTCPFSARAFGKLDDLLRRAGEDRLTLKIRLHSQPWHPFSSVVTRAIVAASTTDGGKAAAKTVMAAVFAHRDEFDLVNHASGPNLDRSLRDMLNLIERYSGIDVAERYQSLPLDREMKWHAKYARQNGIHTTPTFMVDGLVVPDMSSGDDVDAWLRKLAIPTA
jgi:protein-disulfide isomerase